MSKEENKFYKEIYGENAKKAKDNTDKTITAEKLKFITKYPYVDTDKFTFFVNLTKTGDVVKTEIYYNSPDNPKVSYDITSDTFKNLYADVLKWGPEIWSPSTTIKKFVPTNDSLPYNVEKFKIFVTEDNYFFSNFQKLETAWGNSGKRWILRKLPWIKQTPISVPYLLQL